MCQRHVWANKMLQTADSHAAGLAVLPSHQQGYAAVQSGPCFGWSAGVHVCVEVQEWCEGWPSGGLKAM